MIKLRENEKVYLKTHRHSFTLFRELFPFNFLFIALVIGIILILFFVPHWPEWLVDAIPAFIEIDLRFFLIFASLLVLLIFWATIFIIITDYYLDCWIVTNERTIHTELRGLFNRTVSVIQHERIQDISVDIHGFFPLMLNYGDVHMQTAGTFREFILKQVPRPNEIKSIIFKAQKEAQSSIVRQI